jgi:WD40-like Beta Propeller Repeat
VVLVVRKPKGLRALRCLVVALVATAAPINAQPSDTVAYSGFAPLNADIFIADADGSNSKPFLAGPAEDFDASFSHDGKWVVFTSDRADSADIYRAHPVTGADWNGSPTIHPLTTRRHFLRMAA